MAGKSETLSVDPNSLWFSQRTAGSYNRAEKLRESMKENGFVHNTSNPVNVVRTPISLTTIDNTRVAVAQELQISEITILVHDYDVLLPQNMVKTKRFGNAKTWGQALEYRTGNQRPDPLPRYGTVKRPYMRPSTNEE